MDTAQPSPQMAWRVIDFANEPKEYEWWLGAPPIERLRAARKILELAYALQQRPRRAFQPIVTVIER
ncbi:MAG: hypothetical protein KJZ93_15710 [Caldilineaceae bacterium]|nr:hypothetical protein [Caldilineaceae bacterium]